MRLLSREQDSPLLLSPEGWEVSRAKLVLATLVRSSQTLPGRIYAQVGDMKNEADVVRLVRRRKEIHGDTRSHHREGQ